VVAGWERAAGDGPVAINGEVRNDAPDEAAGVAVTVFLEDGTGKLLASAEADLSSTVLPAGRSGSFRAEFPDLFAFAKARFEVRGLHLLEEPQRD